MPQDLCWVNQAGVQPQAGGRGAAWHSFTWWTAVMSSAEQVYRSTRTKQSTSDRNASDRNTRLSLSTKQLILDETGLSHTCSGPKQSLISPPPHSNGLVQMNCHPQAGVSAWEHNPCSAISVLSTCFPFSSADTEPKAWRTEELYITMR